MKDSFMKSPFFDAMRRATEATRGGDLDGATRAIHEAFSGTVAPNSDDAIARGFDGATIDGVAYSSPDSETRQKAAAGGASMLTQTYSGAAGSRDYRLFLPSQTPDGVRGLILMLHGCTQNPDDFSLGTAMNDIAEREGLIVVYPEQTTTHNANGCWNWFEPANQRRGEGEPAILAGIAQQVAQANNVSGHAVFAVGLSAGGAMAAILGAVYSDVFNAVGVHSGLPAGAARDAATAFAAMSGHGVETAVFVDPAAGHARMMIVHGGQDTTVVPSNGVRLFDAMTSVFPKATLHNDPTVEAGLMRRRLVEPDGKTVAEHWEVADLGHAWAGGSPAGTFTSASNPNASEGFVHFFLTSGA